MKRSILYYELLIFVQMNQILLRAEMRNAKRENIYFGLQMIKIINPSMLMNRN